MDNKVSSVFLMLNNMISNNTYCEGKRHLHCKNFIEDFINLYLDNSIIIPSNEYILALLKFIKKADNYMIERHGKFAQLCSERCRFQDLIELFLKYHDNNILKEILNFNLSDDNFNLLTTRIKSDEDIGMIIMNNYFEKLDVIPVEMLEGLKIDYDTLKIICKKNKDDKAFMFAFSQKIPIYNDLLDIVVDNNNLKRLKLLVNYGYVLNNEHIDMSCKNLNIDIIKYILDHNVIPSQKCINFLLNGCKIARKEYKIKNMVEIDNILTKIVELLVDSHYVLTYDDIHEITKKGYKINNIQKYNISFKNSFTDLCCDLGYFPYDQHEIGVKFSLSQLQNECSKNDNIKVIKRMIEVYGIVPDILCLENAYRVKYNCETVKYLIEICNIPPTIKCLKNYVESFGNKMLEILCKNSSYDIIFNNNKIPKSQIKNKTNNLILILRKKCWPFKL